MSVVKTMAETYARQAREAVEARPGEWVYFERLYTAPDEVEAIMADPDAFIAQILAT